MNRPIVVASTILLTKTHEVLMGLRSDCMLWEIPGGKVEDEAVADAGRRELLEETGIVALGGSSFLGFVETTGLCGDNRRYLLMCLVFRDWGGFPRRIEEEKCLMWRWFSVDYLPPLECCTPGTQQILKSILPVAVQMFPVEEETAAEQEPEQESDHCA